MVELLLALLTTLTGIDRTQDADLSAIAQRRAVEISCEGCFSHAGWVYGRDGQAEIIAHNGDPDPVTRLALQWQGSPPHWAILMDARFTTWGCGIHQVGAQFYGVCLFGTGNVSQPTLPPANVTNPPEPETYEPPLLLPNTALTPLGGKMVGTNGPATVERPGPWPIPV